MFGNENSRVDRLDPNTTSTKIMRSSVIIPSRKYPNYIKGSASVRILPADPECMVSLPEETLKTFTTKLGRIAKQSG